MNFVLVTSTDGRSLPVRHVCTAKSCLCTNIFPADFLRFGYTAMLRRKVLLYLTTGRPRLKIISQSLAIDTVQMIYNI